MQPQAAHLGWLQVQRYVPSGLDGPLLLFPLQVAQKDHLVESYVKNKEAQDRDTYIKAGGHGQVADGVCVEGTPLQATTAFARSSPESGQLGSAAADSGSLCLDSPLPPCHLPAGALQVAALLNSKKAKLRELQQQVDELQVGAGGRGPTGVGGAGQFRI